MIPSSTRFSLLSSPRQRGAAAKFAVGVIVLIGALVAMAWGITQLGDTPSGEDTFVASGSSPEWHTVTISSFDIVVTATGELDAKNKLFIRNEVEGKTTITDIVDEGTRVYKGDILVKLADDTITKEIEDSKELVQKANTEKISTEQGLAIEISEAESLKRSDEVKLALAELELAKWKDGTLEQTRRKLQLALVEAEDNLIIAQRRASEAKKLVEAQFISRDEYDQDMLKLKQAESALETAKKDQIVYENYTKPQEEKQFTSDVEQARASLDRTIRKNTSKIATATATYESAVRSLQLKEERLAKLKQQLEYCTMRAPSDGIVVYASSVGSGRSRRSEPIGKNRDAFYNENLIILPDTSQMVALLKVPESRMPDIVHGQHATISIAALRGRLVDAVIYQKATMADEASWSNPDVRQYEVRAELPPNLGSSGTTVSTQGKPNQDQPGNGTENTGPVALNPGMRCTAQIFVDRISNVLTVPIHAVFSEGRERYCYVPAENGRVKQRIVQIGKANETYVEIRTGLKEGDRVLLRKPRPGEIDEPPASDKPEAKDNKPEHIEQPQTMPPVNGNGNSNGNGNNNGGDKGEKPAETPAKTPRKNKKGEPKQPPPAT